jgi:hypothetical protein
MSSMRPLGGVQMVQLPAMPDRLLVLGVSQWPDEYGFVLVCRRACRNVCRLRVRAEVVLCT